MKQTVVINLLGGSGLGKSTVAAEVFVELKKRGESVELVTEYVKSWAWEQRSPSGLENSIYIFGKQLRRESILYGRVEFIVTDCPLGLCAVYEEFYENSTRTVVRDLFKAVEKRQELEGRVKHLNFLLVRQHPFKMEGRYETEEQAKKVDGIVRQMFPGYYVKTASDVIEYLLGAGFLK